MSGEAEKHEEETAADGLHKRERLLKLIVIVGLAGIALIFISSLFHQQNKASSVQPPSDDNSVWEEAAAYREQLSTELGNMVASIEGAGRTKLMLTIDGTIRSIYATDSDIQTNERSGGGEHQNTEKKSCIVIRRSDGSEQAVTIGQMMPSVKGVLVVCEGGDNEEVASRIRSAVSAAVHLSESHICVLKLSD